MRILIVDDEPDAREVIARTLEYCGAEVRSAESVAAALRAISEQPPALIISDIAMPDRDGYELLRSVKSLNGRHGWNIPMIALTAHAGDDERARAVSAGFVAHLSKPIYPSDLINAVARIARRQQPAVPST